VLIRFHDRLLLNCSEKCDCAWNITIPSISWRLSAKQICKNSCLPCALVLGGGENGCCLWFYL